MWGQTSNKRWGPYCWEKYVRKITNIDTWTSAFIVFISIMLEKFPHKAQEMLKYMRDIRLAAKISTGWVQYDELFRLKMARSQLSSWGQVDHKLWVLHLSVNTVNVQTSTTGAQPHTDDNFRPNIKAHGKITFKYTCSFYNRGRCTYKICKFQACRSAMQ